MKAFGTVTEIGVDIKMVWQVATFQSFDGRLIMEMDIKQPMPVDVIRTKHYFLFINYKITETILTKNIRLCREEKTRR